MLVEIQVQLKTLVNECDSIKALQIKFKNPNNNVWYSKEIYMQKHRTNYRKHRIKIITHSLSQAYRVWKCVFQYNSCDRRFYIRYMHTYILKENQNLLKSNCIARCYPRVIFGNFVPNKIVNFWRNCMILLTSEIRLFYWFKIMNFFKLPKILLLSIVKRFHYLHI